MKITCLDGHTLNPGDLSWETFENLGEWTTYDRTPEDQIVSRSANSQALLTNKTPLDAQTLLELPNLKYIGVLATGYNVVDIPTATAQGITVTNVPNYSTDSVAQHATALMLGLASGVEAHSSAVYEGQWVTSPDFCFRVQPMTELAGKTLGLVGFGQIGKAFARIGAAMGMKIIAHTRSPLTPERTGDLAVTEVSLEDLFTQADVVSLHCPLTPQTEHLVNASSLALMKPTALLINTGRGPLIDSKALVEALKAKRIGGAAVDVLSAEPPQASEPLLAAPNCLITPHVAWSTREARTRLMQVAGDNLAAFIQGKPTNVVNTPRK